MQLDNYPKAVVDSLYATADRLERRWSSAGLDIDFRDRMLDAVWRFVERHSLTDMGPLAATRLLTSFWTLNARRDAARAANKPRTVSLTTVELPVTPVECDWRASIVDECRTILVRSGLRSEIAEAFLQRALLGDNTAVIHEVGQRCGYSLTPETLRQWKRRHFGHAAEVLRESADQIGLAHVPCHVPSSAKALPNRERVTADGTFEQSPMGATQ